jgi:hypothetical protein
MFAAKMPQFWLERTAMLFAQNEEMDLMNNS